MKQKSKFRRFWNLDHRKSDGFTLVELIVVIAILAVLGGATVPAYNLYVKKARESADNQVIAAVNTAFASACLENKIELSEVGVAEISLKDSRVYTLSTITPGASPMARATTADSRFDVITLNDAFMRYFEGNENTTIAEEGVKALCWNVTEGSFVKSYDYVDTLMILSNGKAVLVSAEQMKTIADSTYADMGYSGVSKIIKGLDNSTGLLGGILGLLQQSDRLTNVMLEHGLLTKEEAAALSKGINKLDSASLQKANNGLQMSVAKYLANDKYSPNNDPDRLLSLSLGSSKLDVTGAFTEYGGSATSAALAMQYAMVEGYANANPNAELTLYKNGDWVQTGKWPWEGHYEQVPYQVKVSDYLAGTDDPVTAIDTVRKSEGYTAYTKTEQYQTDKNGFVETMTIVGDNLGTKENEGAISIDGYFNDGIASSDSKEVLTELLGSGE